jgi:hypothetical protein
MATRAHATHGLLAEFDDPTSLVSATANARAAGVADRIRFLNEDLLATDLSGATVVTLYLSNDLNLALRPKLERELRSGARVVSHWHAMGDWRPQAAVSVPSEWGERYLYLWTIP